MHSDHINSNYDFKMARLEESYDHDARHAHSATVSVSNNGMTFY